MDHSLISIYNYAVPKFQDVGLLSHSFCNAILIQERKNKIQENNMSTEKEALEEQVTAGSIANDWRLILYMLLWATFQKK